MRDNQFTYRSSAPQLLQSVLNEVLNGFTLDDLDVALEMNSSDLEELLTHLTESPDEREIELSLAQTKAFRNALRETLHELGVEEFHTRTGFHFDEGEEVLKRLDAVIQDSSRDPNE